VVVCVAASALAASLLEGGHTAHHAFHIPIPANDGTFCSLTIAERSLLKKADLIIWDEASMIHQDVADTVCRSLQDIMRSQRPFGGKTVIFTGDFKQLLPVVRCGRGDHHTLHRCEWWPRVHFFNFSRNFRANDDEVFAEMLEEVGSGLMATVRVPNGCCAGSISELVNRVFGEDLINVDAMSMVLTWTLDDASTINEYCLLNSPGKVHEAYAADTFLNCQNPDLYPMEVVAGMRMLGAPPACLNLKIGARYMIIKNLMKYVFNGVRCQLIALNGRRSVFVKLLSGPGAGKTMLLPACVFTISPESSGLPFSIRRRQFPLIPAYAVTTHKAQGQTLRKVGLYITTGVFTHGQLYTALSRTRGWANIVVYSTLQIPELITNCVYRHVLNQHA
jgi:ATP-dependent DNA helicase PIF1